MNESFILENDRVLLQPLTLDNFEELISIASQNNLVQYSPSNISTRVSLKDYVETAIKQLHNGTSIPFIIYDKQKKSICR